MKKKKKLESRPETLIIAIGYQIRHGRFIIQMDRRGFFMDQTLNYRTFKAKLNFFFQIPKKKPLLQFVANVG